MKIKKREEKSQESDSGVTFYPEGMRDLIIELALLKPVEHSGKTAIEKSLLSMGWTAISSTSVFGNRERKTDAMVEG